MILFWSFKCSHCICAKFEILFYNTTGRLIGLEQLKVFLPSYYFKFKQFCFEYKIDIMHSLRYFKKNIKRIITIFLFDIDIWLFCQLIGQSKRFNSNWSEVSIILVQKLYFYRKLETVNGYNCLKKISNHLGMNRLNISKKLKIMTFHVAIAYDFKM